MGTFIISNFVTSDPNAPTVRSDYAADSFSRSGPALGSTEIGGLPWQQNAGSVHQVVNQRLKMSTVPASSHAYAWFEEPHLKGVLSATLAGLTGGPNRGLFVGLDPATGTGYLLVSDGAAYTLRARISSGSLTTLATASGVVPALGDRLELQVDGSLLTARINGVQVMQVTNTALVQGVGKGVWAFANGGSSAVAVEWDNIAWSEL